MADSHTNQGNRSPVPWFVATVAVVVATAIFCAVTLSQRASGSEDTRISAPDSAPIASDADAAVGVGDCGAVVDRRFERATCRTSQAPYAVVAVGGAGDSCAVGVSQLHSDGHTLCLVVDLITDGCYTRPTDNAWIAPAACGSAGSMRVRSVHQGARQSRLCTSHQWSYWWERPPVTVCVTRY